MSCDIRRILPDKEGLRTWIFITCGVQIIIGLLFFIAGAIVIRAAGTLGGVFSIIAAILGIVATFFRSDVLKIVFLVVECMMVLTIVLIVALSGVITETMTAGHIVAASAAFVVLLIQLAGISEIGYYLWLKRHPAPERQRNFRLQRLDDEEATI